MNSSSRTAWHEGSPLVPIVAILAGVLAIYWPTTSSLIDAWKDSTTYSHGFLILPIFMWLLWERRSLLSTLPVRPWWPGLCGVAAIGLVWLTGRLEAAAEPSQFALVALVPAAVATLLGSAWVRALAFPFAFLFFAVPFGDSLIPPMMDWTADFVVVALKLCGVPVHQEGNDFSIPSGDWSVIAACSGIRYVFACLTVSSLYAWTVYRGTPRRLAFIGIALATVIVANWLRAFGIVMLAHLSDNQFALGIDHVIYGSVFFVAIMAILFSLGALWRERPAAAAEVALPPRPARGPNEVSRGMPASARRAAAVSAVLVVLVAWPLLFAGMGGQAPRIAAPIGEIVPRLGWRLVDEPATSWRPQLRDPAGATSRTFEKDGKRVSVYIGLFDRPTADAKLASSANRLVPPDDPRWKQVHRGTAEVSSGGRTVPVRTATLVGVGGRVIVWHWYWVDGTVTTSAARAALLQVFARFRGHDETSAWVTVSAIQASPTASTSPALEAFLPQMLDSIDDALRRAR